MSCNSILVTGGSGFVGRALLQRLTRHEGRHVFAALRNPSAEVPAGVTVRAIGDIDGHTHWAAALEGVDVVVHAAARVHVMHEPASDPLAAFRVVNVQGSLSLARQAAAAGIRRLVYISSVKVNGESTVPGQSFSAHDTPAPLDPYGQSKLEAERALQALAAETGMQVVIIRPVLVYGPGVKANFLSMMRWLDRGVPLPLGAVHNLRSLVCVDNLVDLIDCCISHPAAANQVFLASDGDDISTPRLLTGLARAMDRPARLLPVPANWLLAVGRLCGKQAVLQRLLGNLQVDIALNRQLLGWVPPIAVEAALAETVAAYRGVCSR